MSLLTKNCYLETRRSGMELFLTHLKENGILQPLRKVERLEDTGHPIFKGVSALIRGILKKKNGRDTKHINADDSNTELLFRIIQWFALVLSWHRQQGSLPLRQLYSNIFSASFSILPMFGSSNPIALCTSLCGHLSC